MRNGFVIGGETPTLRSVMWPRAIGRACAGLRRHKESTRCNTAPNVHLIDTSAQRCATWETTISYLKMWGRKDRDNGPWYHVYSLVFQTHIWDWKKIMFYFIYRLFQVSGRSHESFHVINCWLQPEKVGNNSSKYAKRNTTSFRCHLCPRNEHWWQERSTLNCGTQSDAYSVERPDISQNWSEDSSELSLNYRPWETNWGKEERASHRRRVRGRCLALQEKEEILLVTDF